MPWSSLGCAQRPDVLQRCIPGCESITAAGDNAYDVAMTAAVGPVKAHFKGRMELTDIVPPTSYRLNWMAGAARPASARARHRCSWRRRGRPSRGCPTPPMPRWAASSHKIGSRLVDGAARKLADEFFQRFAAEFGAPPRDDARMGQAIPDIAATSWPRRMGCRRPRSSPSPNRLRSRATRGRGLSWRWWPWQRRTCFCTTGHSRRPSPKGAASAGNAPWTASISKS